MRFTFLILSFLLTSSCLSAQISARLFRHPDVSQTQISFIYGGDVWVVSKEGGVAARLTSAKGGEQYPRFSPDGKHLAFTGNYDGNADIYTIPVGGGIPKRITHHGMYDRILDWYPDGKHLLYSSSMKSEKQRFAQFYKISTEGGLPEKLPMAQAEFGSLSKDGKKIAFTDRSRITRSWKRYRGGMAADIWIFDLDTYASKNITDNAANDEIPMWSGNTIYYLSDNGPLQRFNIWAYDIKSGKNRQVTKFTEFDVSLPAQGPDELVFEAGGNIYLLDKKSEAYNKVDIEVLSDMITVKPRKESVENYVQNMTIAPDGNRAVVEARGEVFSLPSEKGYVQNLTRSTGFAERYPAWSPSGRYIAYWSDKSGEYELTLRDMKEGAKEKQVSKLGPGFRYNIYWSPDSKKVAYVDQTMTINIIDIETGENTAIDQDLSLFEGGLRGWTPSWSPDSRWLTYSRQQDNGNGAIYLYSLNDKKLTKATEGFYADINPTFGPDGKYLYCVTNRSFRPVYSDFDNTWIYPNATQLAAIALRDEVASLLVAKNDEVSIKEEKEEEEAQEEDKKEEKAEEEKKEEKLVIELNNFERRMEVMPAVTAGNMGNLSLTKGKVVFMRYPNSGSTGGQSKLVYYDLKDRKEKTIVDGAYGYEMSADGKKALVMSSGRRYGVVDIAPKQKMEKTLAVKDMEMDINPREEWKQIFNDVWRFQRDFFYDKDMHGVDWDAMRVQYSALLEHCVDRADVNFLIGELIGELNASHTYRGGGDQETPERKAVGYLGVDWAKDGDYFKIKKIVRGAAWDNSVRSPLDAPGVAIKEGSYILAVNGIALNEYPDPWAAFEGLAGKTVELTYSDSPSWEDVKKVVIKPMRSETRLRNLAWIESNRKKVEEASDGKIGYVYVPSTGIDGQNELARMFYGQWSKEGLVVDERFNNGGQIPDRFIELLNRKSYAYWKVRDGKTWQWPPVGHFGSMAMLINGWSGSGGDAFPDYFRKAELGPLIGGRTWGGLIGISGAPSLVDGGSVTVPTFRMYNPDGTWFKEGYGVAPDIEVKENPTLLAKGIDSQLQKAIEDVLKQMKEKGPLHPKEPGKEDRSRVIKP